VRTPADCRPAAWSRTYATRACAGARQQSTRQRKRECRRRRTAALLTSVPELGCCGHAVAQLPGARNLQGATCAGAVEGATRGCGSTASGKLRLAPALEAWAGWSAVRPRPESTSSSTTGTRGRSRAVASAVKSRLGPHRDIQHTIKARRRAESVDNNNDNRSCHNDNRGRGWCHDNDDDREHSWSPSQRGPRAFGRRIRDAKFPSRFWAPTNIPRYDEDTNPVCGSRTTGSRATSAGRPTTSS
jgi:hypothetical protein